MVVDDLDVLRARARPAEAQPKLIVYPHAVLSGPVALERFEAIARRDTEVFKPARNLQLTELSPRHRFDAREPPDAPPRCA